jgi:hypothetical protein
MAEGSMPTREVEAGERAGQQSSEFRWWLWLPLFCIAYILSTGPVIRMSRVGMLRDTRAIYYPLILFSDACKPFDSFMNWYVNDLWGS